jgi:hypothetical protein
MKKHTKTARQGTTLAATALAATRGAGSGMGGAGFGLVDPGTSGTLELAGVIVGGGGLGRQLDGHGVGGGVFGRDLPLVLDQGVAVGWG